MGLFQKKKRRTEVAEVEYTASDSNASANPGQNSRDIRRGNKLFSRQLREKPWIARGIMVSLCFAVLFSGFYGIFRSRAEKYEENPLEWADNITWLYQNCYLLYRDLCNTQSEEVRDYTDIYLETEQGHGWILDKERRQEYMDLLNVFAEISSEAYHLQEELSGASLQEAVDQGQLSREQIDDLIEQGLLEKELLEKFEGSEDIYDLTWAECHEVEQDMEKIESYFSVLELYFSDLNSCYDYIIEDDITGNYVTNMSLEDKNRSAEEQYFQLSFQFDDSGNVRVKDDICGKDTSYIRKLANEAIRVNEIQSQVGEAMSTFVQYGKIKGPVNCTITFAVSTGEWEARKEKSQGLYVGRQMGSAAYGATYYYNFSTSAYENSGLTGILALCMMGLFLLGTSLPLPEGHKPWKDERICAVSLEFLVGFGSCLMTCVGLLLHMIVYVASGRAGGAFSEYLGINFGMGRALAMVLNIVVLTVFAFCCWYVGICARALPGLGVKRYIRQRSLIYRFFPFIKQKIVGVYEALAHMDLTRNANRTIVKILIINAIILALICCFWVGGFAIVAVYSLVLYFILRKYVSELQKRYQILLKAVDEIAAGNLNVSILEDLGIFEPFREQVFKIQDGLQKAVDTEVKSQRMKVELVTNMSHDLKTPLTAIITYINLLKEKDITQEQREEYLNTLERKSLRLKSLIEDLFEFSKASSQNITLNIMDLDIMNLVKQVNFEMSDKLGEMGLDVRMNLTEEKVILPLDSQKTYRIYENLFGNIAKYALPGTRVYVNGFRIGDTVVITLKNISAQEITVDSSELTERFVRGDASRNTEGSGLGLAIAKSFMELQGGELVLEVDGDLFKATTTWHMPQAESYPEVYPNIL